MNFANPLGFLVLLGALPLLAAYFLRRRQAPRTVSALFLWRSLAPAAAAGPRFERFRRERSLLLELFALLMAALFLANLRCGSDSPRGHLVLVVDGSLSMTAKGADGQMPIERAREAARAEIDRSRAGRVTLLEAGVTPRLLAGPEADVSDALEVLDRWTPAGPNATPTVSFQMAQELAGPGRPYTFFTDATAPEDAVLPETLRWVALGESRENVGFVAAQRRDVAGKAQLAVRVASFRTQDSEATVEFTPERGVRQSRTVKLGPGKAETIHLELEDPGAVSVVLDRDDALQADNRLRLLPAPERPVDVAVLEGLEGTTRTALLKVLAILPGSRMVGEDATPERLARALSFGPRDSMAAVSIEAPGKQRTFLGPFFTEKSHPLFEDVRLDGVAWTAGENPPGRPLVRAGDAVLISEEIGPQGSRVHVNLQLSRSNVQRTSAWPVLIGNLLRSATTRAPGFARKHLALGEEVSVTTVSGASWSVVGENTRRPLLGVGTLLLPPLPVGRYQLLRDKEPVDEVEVLALDAAESELRERSKGTREPERDVALLETGDDGRRAPAWPLVLLMAAVLANFAFTRRAG